MLATIAGAVADGSGAPAGAAQVEGWSAAFVASVGFALVALLAAVLLVGARPAVAARRPVAVTATSGETSGCWAGPAASGT